MLEKKPVVLGKKMAACNQAALNKDINVKSVY